MDIKSYIDAGISSKQVKRTETLDSSPKIKGYEFKNQFNINAFLDSYFTTGFQATNLKRAIDIIKIMRKEKAHITLAFTSNMVSSGLREIICYLVKNKLVHMIVTPAGGIEEDIIKSIKPFALGSFSAKGSSLLENGINRIGNIFVPNDRYYEFEKFIRPVLSKFNRLTCEQLTFELGKAIANETSFLYWAYKNTIPVFCPAVTDGALGDMIYFYKKKNPDFILDVSQDMTRIIDITMNVDKSGVIALGGGVVKHHVMNANLFREGADYAIYITTASGFDGSDSGGNMEEAISWGKMKPDGLSVKVQCEATIAFPLLVQGGFIDENKS